MRLNLALNLNFMIKSMSGGCCGGSGEGCACGKGGCGCGQKDNKDGKEGK